MSAMGASHSVHRSNFSVMCFRGGSFSSCNEVNIILIPIIAMNQYFCIKNHLDLELLGSIMLPITNLHQRASQAVQLLLAYLARSLPLENPFVLCNTMIHVNFHVSMFRFINLMVKPPRWALKDAWECHENCLLFSNDSQANFSDDSL